MTECDEASILRQYAPLTAKDVLDAAKAGDALACRVAEQMMQALGRAAAYIACVMNPDVFVIGGGVSRAGEYLTEGIRRYYQQYYLQIQLVLNYIHFHLNHLSYHH